MVKPTNNKICNNTKIIDLGNNVFMKYDRIYKVYVTKDICIANTSIDKLILHPIENTTDASLSLDTLNKIIKKFENFYHIILNRCAEKLRKPISTYGVYGATPKEIYDSLYYTNEMCPMEISIDGTYFTITFSGGGIEFDELYEVTYKGNIETDEFEIIEPFS